MSRISMFLVSQLDGEWFTRMMITHYEGKQSFVEPGLCITFNIYSYKNVRWLF